MASKNGQSIIQDIKDVITYLGGIGAISYAVGFIVVTTNLLQYGISDLNLLNARYVSAGFLFIFLLVLSMIPAFCLIIFIISQKLKEPKKSDQIASGVYHRLINPYLSKYSSLGEIDRKSVGLILVLMVSLVPPNVIFLTSTKIWQGREVITLSSLLSFILKLVSNTWMLYSTLFIGWFAPLFVTGVLLCLIILLSVSEKNWLSDISIQLFLVGGVVLCLLWATSNYAHEIYPHISPAMGGGDAVDVSLVFDNESAQTAMQLVPLYTNFTTAPLKLLDENDKDYYFLVPDGGTKASFHAVEIDKGLVKGLIFNVLQ